jgi:putative transposase
VNYSQQQNALPKQKKADPALGCIHSQVLQDCLQRVDKAFRKFFEDTKRKKSGQTVKIGYPRMKKLDRYCSLTYPQVWMKNKDKLTEVVKFRLSTDSRFAVITLPGIGPLKIRLHRQVDWSSAKTVTVKRTAAGDWSVSISVEQPLIPTLSDNGKSTGVDVGLMNLVATSDKHYTEHPKFIRKSEDKLKKAQRSLCKKEKGSNGYQRQKIRVARIHGKVANQRSDFLHKLSLWLVMNYSAIAFEKLNIPAMVRNPHLAKSILDAGWGTLIRFTAYKSVMLRGNEIKRVNPAYTTQDCSKCGCRVPKTLAERMHRCPQCGLIMERDHNSANVIEQRAFGSNTVGQGSCPNRLSIPELTQGETRSSAAVAARGKSCRGSLKPRLIPHLSRG